MINYIAFVCVGMVYNIVKHEERWLKGLHVRECERDSAASGKIQMCQVSNRELDYYRKSRGLHDKANLSVSQGFGVQIGKSIV